jgi:hypothetical protein
MAIKLNDAIRTAIINSALIPYISGTGGTSGSAGILKVYGGTQAASPGDAATGPILVQINNIAWATGTTGTSLITGTRTGTAGTAGTATWARLSNGDGTSYVVDGSCGTSTLADYVMDVAGIAASSVVSLLAATFVQPAS